MPTITIDNKSYDLDSLTNEAKAQLASIQFVDAELARLQAQAAAPANRANCLRQGAARSSLDPADERHDEGLMEVIKALLGEGEAVESSVGDATVFSVSDEE